MDPFQEKTGEFVSRMAELRYNECVCRFELIFQDKGGLHNMRLLLILGVSAAFLAAIFTSGYNDKPGSNSK